MVFSGLTFLLYFLPAFLLCYFAAPSRRSRNLVLTFFSLLFYAWGEPVWVVLLLISSLTDFAAGHLIHRGYRRFGLLFSLVVNLGLLGFFKYTDMVLSTVAAVSGSEIPLLRIALPIGISFYTFQTMSYTIDMYRGDTELQSSFMNFLLYVSLFPQLVAGPIVRYRDVAAEIEGRKESFALFAEGVERFAYGLAKKVLIANTAGKLATVYLMQEFHAVSTPAAWFGALIFTVQIFFDFAGYSDMAIGLGKMVGFHFKENFDYPLVSRSASEFWRRWHISLGSFLRDYVYIPLGGNRSRMIRNLFITWFLTGLWHGASWNFVLWGLYYGVIIGMERLFLEKLLRRLPRFVSHLYLVLLVVYGFVIFYYTDVKRIYRFTLTLLGLRGTGFSDPRLLATVLSKLYWIVFALLAATPLYKRLLERFVRPEYRRMISLAVLLLSITVLVGQSYNPFLYFRF